MKAINRILCIFSTCILTSCMNTEIIPVKFYKEEIPLKIDNNIIMSGFYFNNIYQYKFYYLWNVEKRYVYGDGISIYTNYKGGYFPTTTSINLNQVNLNLKNGEKIEYESIKKRKQKYYYLYEENQDGKIVSNSLYEKDGKIIFDSSESFNAPEGFVGEYIFDAIFYQYFKLKDINEIELLFTVEESGIAKECVITIHPDFKYKYVTEPMILKWAVTH